jgi:hypothetical protein
VGLFYFQEDIMIRIYSIEQALSLRGTIPELAIIRALQFMGDGYSPEEHGHIIVIQEGDDLSQAYEIGPNGLCDEDELPTYEFVEAFIESCHVVYEAVYQIDDSRTVAVIAPDAPWLDKSLRAVLSRASVSPQPLPTLNRRAL